VRTHSRIVAAGVAAALALGLAAAPATAADQATDSAASPAAAATFSKVSISGLKKKVNLPKSGTRTVKFTVNISGTASDGGVTDVNGDGFAVDYKAHDASFAGAKVVSVKSNVHKKTRTVPRVNSPVKVSTGKNSFSLAVHSYTSPGLYEVRVPITQNDWTGTTRVSVTKVAKLRFELLATGAVSKASTTYYAPSWKPGKTATFTVTAPVYLKGAKATIFYKKSGAKKFTKVKSAKFKAKSTAYRSTAKIKTKALSKSGKFYIKVSAVKWAKGYKTKTDKIVVRKR